MIKEKDKRTLFRLDPDTKDMVLEHQALRATLVNILEGDLIEEIKKETKKDEIVKKLKAPKEENRLIIHHRLIYTPQTIKKGS